MAHTDVTSAYMAHTDVTSSKGGADMIPLKTVSRLKSKAGLCLLPLKLQFGKPGCWVFSQVTCGFDQPLQSFQSFAAKVPSAIVLLGKVSRFAGSLT